MAHLCVPQNQALGVCRGFVPDIQVCGTHGREDLVNATITSNAEEEEDLSVKILVYPLARGDNQRGPVEESKPENKWVWIGATLRKPVRRPFVVVVADGFVCLWFVFGVFFFFFGLFCFLFCFVVGVFLLVFFWGGEGGLFLVALRPSHMLEYLGRIYPDTRTCCHTETEVKDSTFYLTQSQYTDTGPTSLSADPITPGACQGSLSYANL